MIVRDRKVVDGILVENEDIMSVGTRDDEFLYHRELAYKQDKSLFLPRWSLFDSLHCDDSFFQDGPCLTNSIVMISVSL